MENKTVKIPLEDFLRLCRYFLMDNPTNEDYNALKTLLNAKLDSLARRELYTAYKTANTPQKRNEAFEKYIESIGIIINNTTSEL